MLKIKSNDINYLKQRQEHREMGRGQEGKWRFGGQEMCAGEECCTLIV